MIFLLFTSFPEYYAILSNTNLKKIIYKDKVRVIRTTNFTVLTVRQSASDTTSLYMRDEIINKVVSSTRIKVTNEQILIVTETDNNVQHINKCTFYE